MLISCSQLTYSNSNVMLISFSYSEYMNNIASNDTTNTLSRDEISLSDVCICHLTTCAKLVTEELRGVVCVNHTTNSMVNKLTHMYKIMSI